jgi:hypothetical protein
MKRFVYKSAVGRETFLTDAKWNLCHNANDWRQNNSRITAKCLFQSSFLNKALETTELKRKRRYNQPYLARARRTGLHQFCTPKIAGASSGQSRMTILCAKNWRRWCRIIQWTHRLVTPRQAYLNFIIQTTILYKKLFSYIYVWLKA